MSRSGRRSGPDARATNRLHLDVYPTGRDDTLPPTRRIEVVEAKVAELEAHGAAVVRRREDDPEDPVYYVVMTDPEATICVS